MSLLRESLLVHIVRLPLSSNIIRGEVLSGLNKVLYNYAWNFKWIKKMIDLFNYLYFILHKNDKG